MFPCFEIFLLIGFTYKMWIENLVKKIWGTWHIVKKTADYIPFMVSSW
jgi:hypothetical protein